MTFSLAVVEAMARGLPVVASDWDGHKDTIVDGETGLLVPTWMVSGASPDAGARLDLGAVDFDLYLAKLGQVVAVDVGSTPPRLPGSSTTPRRGPRWASRVDGARSRC